MTVPTVGRDGVPDPAATRRRPPVGRSRAAIAALLACLAPALLLAPAAIAQGAAPPSLVLSPSKVRAEAAPGLGLGPFGLANGTSTTYGVRVRPVLLGQDRGGDLTVRDDQRSLRRARRFLAPGTPSFRLSPGAQRSSTGIVRRMPPSKSLYGGLLFQARPQGISDRQIIEVLRLNASVLLDPPPAERRVRLSAGRMRAEQAGERGIRLLVPVANRGNAYLPAQGDARVVDDRGRTRAAVDLGRVQILPGATVDLRGRIDASLPPGAYSLRGAATMEDETVQARGEMLIGADGRVEFRAASLLEAPAPTAYSGDPVELRHAYRNEGNVPFAPDAEVRVRPVVRGSVGEVEATQPLEVAEAEPGDSAGVTGSVELPGEAQSYELEIVLADGGRELDSRSIGVTPQARAGLPERIGDWIRRNALLLVLVLAALLVALTVGGLQYLRRVRAAAGDGSAVPSESQVPASGSSPHASAAGRVSKPEDVATNRARQSVPAPEAVATNGSPRRPGPAPAPGRPAMVSLAKASFEDLRALGMSTTQANRVLRHRDRRGGFSSVDELDEVPGFPRHLRARIKRSLVE